jgi:hypothetical protein
LSTSGRMSAKPDVTPMSAKRMMFRSILKKLVISRERGRRIGAQVESKNAVSA